MNEKLPLLQKAIAQLKGKEATSLADELTQLVETLFTQIEKKRTKEITETEKQIDTFLKEHEEIISIGDRQAELRWLKTSITWTETEKAESNRRSRLRGKQETEEEEDSDISSDTEEKTSRRERPRAKALWVSLLVGWVIYAYNTSQGKNTPQARTPEPIASWVDYEQASLEQKRNLCYTYLQQIWFSKILAAWIIGNIEQESGFDTKAVGDNWAAHGFCQWRDGRRVDLQNFYASSTGKWRPITDYTLQLDFIKYELESKESEAYGYFKKATTPTEAARLFSKYYERPWTPHNENRIASANKILAQDTRNIA